MMKLLLAIFVVATAAAMDTVINETPPNATLFSKFGSPDCTAVTTITSMLFSLDTIGESIYNYDFAWVYRSTGLEAFYEWTITSELELVHASPCYFCFSSAASIAQSPSTILGQCDIARIAVTTAFNQMTGISSYTTKIFIGGSLAWQDIKSTRPQLVVSLDNECLSVSTDQYTSTQQKVSGTKPRHVLAGMLEMQNTIDKRSLRGQGTEEPVGNYYTLQVNGTRCNNEWCAACTSSTSCDLCVIELLDPETLCDTCIERYNLSIDKEGQPVCTPICEPHCTCETPYICTGCIFPYANPTGGCTDCVPGYVMIEDECVQLQNEDSVVAQSTELTVNCSLYTGSAKQCEEARCYYCTLNHNCLESASDCPSCTSFVESTCNVSGLSEGCSWCDTEQLCKSAKLGCMSSCSLATTQSSCVSYAGCSWCPYGAARCLSIDDFDANCINSCPDYNSNQTACVESFCQWCNYTTTCMDPGESCTSCFGLSESECAFNSICSWCASSSSCLSAVETCLDCSLASASKCGEDEFAGCSWCEKEYACMNALNETALAACSCSTLTSKTACQTPGGCAFCDGTLKCYPIGFPCISCASRNETLCEPIGDCVWSDPHAACVTEYTTIIPCRSFPEITSCTSMPGCQWCSNLSYCAARTDTCIVPTGPSEATTPSSGGGGGNNSLPLWAFAAIGAGGVALLAVIISAAVCIVIAGKRRKRKHVSDAERSEIAMATVTTALTTGELAGMHSVPASEMLLEVSKSTLTFGSKHAILKLDAPVETTFELTNTGKKEAHVTAHVPPADETEGRYDLRVQPESVTLGPSESCTLSVTLTPRCTMTIKTAVALWRHPARLFTLVDVEGEVEPSTRLDWNELQISQQLGVGGFGTVYKATWRGMPVAVKEMASHLWDVEETREEVMREVDLMNRLRSPFIICFHGVVMTKAHKAIVMELAPMGSVKSILSKQQLTNQVRIKIAMNCAAGMQLLHANGIMHRDLKADNLLVFSLNPREEVLVKLTDFGTSRCVADEEARQYTKGIGTPCYMAPELMSGQPYGMAADVYSFGVTLYELVAQKDPYCDFENHFAIAAFVSKGDRLEIPPSPLADLTARCWAHDPAARPTFAQIVADLSALVS